MSWEEIIIINNGSESENFLYHPPIHIIFDATVGGSSNIIRMIQYIVPSYVLVTQFVLFRRVFMKPFWYVI